MPAWLRHTLALFVVVPLLACPSNEKPAQDSASDDAGVAEPAARSREPDAVSGWVEMDGERTELSEVYALRIEECPGDFVTHVFLTNRPLDVAAVVEPLGPPMEIVRELETGVLGQGDLLAVVSHRAGQPYLTARRPAPGGGASFNGPGVLSTEAPQIAVDTDDRIEGTWRGETNEENWVGDSASFDFAFAANVSSDWLAGDELPADGGAPGEVVQAFLEALVADDLRAARPHGAELVAGWPEPDAPADEVAKTLGYLKGTAPTEWEIVGGRSSGRRAIVGWSGEAMSGAAREGFFFLERRSSPEAGGADRWMIVHSSPCIRLGR